MVKNSDIAILAIIGFVGYFVLKPRNSSVNVIPQSGLSFENSKMASANDDIMVSTPQTQLKPQPTYYTDQQRYAAKFPVSNATLAQRAIGSGADINSLNQKLQDAYRRVAKKGVQGFNTNL